MPSPPITSRPTSTGCCERSSSSPCRPCLPRRPPRCGIGSRAGSGRNVPARPEGVANAYERACGSSSRPRPACRSWIWLAASQLHNGAERRAGTARITRIAGQAEIAGRRASHGARRARARLASDRRRRRGRALGSHAVRGDRTGRGDAGSHRARGGPHRGPGPEAGLRRRSAHPDRRGDGRRARDQVLGGTPGRRERRGGTRSDRGRPAWW